MNHHKNIIFLFLVMIFVTLRLMYSGFGSTKAIYNTQIKNYIKKYEPTTTIYHHSIFDNLTIQKVEFDIKKDLIVFLHIPKTGGSEFEVKIIFNLTRFDYQNEEWINTCEKKPKEVTTLSVKVNHTYAKYYCGRGLNYTIHKPDSMINSWLFSRYTFGWALRWKCMILDNICSYI
jgi:hypothetical protein